MSEKYETVIIIIAKYIWVVIKWLWINIVRKKIREDIDHKIVLDEGLL